MSLLMDTQARLEKSLAAGKTLVEIAAMSEGTVDYEWLCKFASGKTKDPGVTRVEALNRTLKRRRSKAS